jgi:hypothetical protein
MPSGSGGVNAFTCSSNAPAERVDNPAVRSAGRALRGGILATVERTGLPLTPTLSPGGEASRA